jgi:hypothetical protein
VADRTIGELLMPGSEKVDDGFRGCQFYYPVSNGGPIKQVACDVEITGRTLRHRPYEQGVYYIKVKITWVGDCEPDTTCEGWMLADDRAIDRTAMAKEHLTTALEKL